MARRVQHARGSSGADGAQSVTRGALESSSAGNRPECSRPFVDVGPRRAAGLVEIRGIAGPRLITGRGIRAERRLARRLCHGRRGSAIASDASSRPATPLTSISDAATAPPLRAAEDESYAGRCLKPGVRSCAAEAERPARREGPMFTERSKPTRESILAAARHRFTERGYDRTTIRLVAFDAGVDPAPAARRRDRPDRVRRRGTGPTFQRDVGRRRSAGRARHPAAVGGDARGRSGPTPGRLHPAGRGDGQEGDRGRRGRRRPCRPSRCVAARARPRQAHPPAAPARLARAGAAPPVRRPDRAPPPLRPRPPRRGTAIMTACSSCVSSSTRSGASPRSRAPPAPPAREFVAEVHCTVCALTSNEISTGATRRPPGAAGSAVPVGPSGTAGCRTRAAPASPPGAPERGRPSALAAEVVQAQRTGSAAPLMPSRIA